MKSDAKKEESLIPSSLWAMKWRTAKIDHHCINWKGTNKMKTISFLAILLFFSNHCVAQELSVDTTFNHLGNIESITYGKDGKKVKTIFYSNHYKSSEINYKHDFKDGLCTWYFPNGNLRSKFMYVHDLEDGEAEGYFESGKIKWRCQYKMGSKNGLCIAYYENGEKQSENYFKGNKKDSIYITYFKNGNKSSIGYYKKDKRQGPFILYYENGNTKVSGAYKDDRMNGERLCYDEAGNLFSGNFIVRNENGIIERQCKCVNGKPEGELKVYVDSTLKILANFKNGKPDGLTLYYNYGGQDSLTEIYKEGVFVKAIKNGK